MKVRLIALLALPALLASASAHGQPSTNSESQDGYHATIAGSVGPDQAYTVTLMTRPYKVPAFDSKGYMAAYIYLEGSCAGTVSAVIKQVAVKRRLSAPNG
ncbi:hypothetical protein EQZ23_17875 [Sphingomonas sp. UV9]|uniref:hypothetical protein n=1 Tax=Sphingomonas sp. UV9 TaxID=1851410 RepID=UPI000FFB4191|nr:hypothetical protein [Sphingomonas sp. UV9]RXD02491.1 hypothetical protein EQZ23_17875 [Sphingomonas sp. UV9]